MESKRNKGFALEGEPHLELISMSMPMTSSFSEEEEVKHVCLFCFNELPPGQQEADSLEYVVPYSAKSLRISLNDPGKNEACFELLCKLFNVSSESSENEDGIKIKKYCNRRRHLPLCHKCQNLYQEMYQLSTQIDELEMLLKKRAEMVTKMIRKSARKAKYGIDLTQLTMMGLDIFRKKVINSECNDKVISDKGRVLPKRGCTKPQRFKVKVEPPELMEEESMDHANALGIENSDFEDQLINGQDTLQSESEGEEDDQDDDDPLYIPVTGSRKITIAENGAMDDSSEGVISNKSEKVKNSKKNERKVKRRGRPPKIERPPDYVPPPFEIGRTGKPKTRYSCHLCEEEHIGYGPFKKHYAEVHPEEIKYTCKFCKLHFKALWDVRTHQRKHTGERPYTCDHLDCSKKFSTRKSKTAHMKNFHSGNEKMFACEHFGCGKTFPTDGALKNHLDVHSQAIIFCKSCSGTYKSVASFNKHNKNKHESKAECTEPILNPDKKQLEEIGVKEVKTRLVCHLCWTGLIGLLNFQQHFATEHPGKDPKQCKCGKRFSTYIDCRRHAIKHTAEKNCQCHICPRRFHTTRELNAHAKIHLPRNQDKTEICDTCGMAFANKSYLNVHRKKHSGERWICEYCGRSYSDKKGYILHKNSLHLNIRPHKCPSCPRSYTEKAQLTKHMRTHTKEKPFACPLCDKSFPYTSSRARHIEEVHNKVVKKSRMSKTNTVAKPSHITLDDSAVLKEEIVETIPTVKEDDNSSLVMVQQNENPDPVPQMLEDDKLVLEEWHPMLCSGD